MSLEGGTEDYSTGDAIGCCPGCYSSVQSLELDGYCPRCAGVPDPPPPTRADHLRIQADTFRVAITKTSDPFKRTRYAAALERAEAELEQLEKRG